MKSRILAARTSLLAAALLTGAASPVSYRPLLALGELGTPQAATAAPAPTAPSRFTPAPVPNIDLQFSTNRKVDPTQVQVTPSVFHQPKTYQGEGYTPYSSIPEDQPSKRLLPTAGLNLSVPLE